MSSKPESDLHLRSIVTVLPRYAYRFSDEAALHSGIARVLWDAGISFSREFIADPADRFDFLCDGGIVIEAKIHGSISPALSQCARYAARDDVSAVVLVTSRAWGRAPALSPDATVHGKPLRVVHLRGQSF